MCCVATCALWARPAGLRHPSHHHQAAVWLALWHPTTLVGPRLALARPVWGPSASNTWRPGSWALASIHGSGSRGQRPRGKPPLGLLQGRGWRRGSRWLGPGRLATQAQRASLQPGPSGQKAGPVAGLRPGPGAARGRGGACVPGPGLGRRMAAAARSPPR